MRVVRFELRALLLTTLVCGMVFATSPLTAPDTRAAAPRVVIVVGPAGNATNGYRADGDQAAMAATAAGADVTKVYSPDATWPKVKAALQGASIVVYMGHGNGFPSRYGPTLNKSTKDGVGLNPVAGVDDVAHQYFGESYLAKYVRLAPHAVVLLHHLCYASGNPEPGLPEGDLATGQQRVDNMAAGWLAAGAEAVLAEAYGDPAHYVSKILAGRSTIETIWRTGPTAHRHVLAFPSKRTPGMTGLMDPTRKSSGFYRSIVLRAEMRADEVAAGAALVGKTPGQNAPPSPSPRTRPAVSRMTLENGPSVGSRLDLTLVFADPKARPPGELGVGVRWDPISLDPATPLADPSVTSTGPSPSPRPSASPRPSDPLAGMPSQSPVAPPTPTSTAAIVLPEVSPLVTPEVLGDVVDLADVKLDAQGLAAAIDAPDAPGLYRLVATVHDAEGVALDDGTQQPIPALLVQVMPALSAVVQATRHIDVPAGSDVDLPVLVRNTGTVPWIGPETRLDGVERRAGPKAESEALLVGHWVRLDTPTSAGEEPAVWAKLGPAPGATEVVSLHFVAPARTGEYVLALDVVSSLDGSLTAHGREPVVVRVTVGPRGTPFGATSISPT